MIVGFTDFRVFLKKIYDQRKKEEGPYSYLTFNMECGLGENNALYQVIKGKRTLSAKNARKICDKLSLKGDERLYFLQLVEYQNAKDVASRDRVFKKLMTTKSKCTGSQFSRKQLELFSEWYHIAVFELLHLPFAKDDPEWIGSHLRPKISARKARASLDLLQETGTISYDDSRGRLYPCTQVLSTGSEIRGMVFKTYHFQMLNLAQRALSQEKAVNRDVSAVTIPLPDEGLKELKDLTAEFRKKLLALGEKYDHSDRIFQVNIQGFPLSEAIRKDES